ncbi:MAG: hypothetical protein WA669_16795, partial [Pseudolabrys sp.]
KALVPNSAFVSARVCSSTGDPSQNCSAIVDVCADPALDSTSVALRSESRDHDGQTCALNISQAN